MKRIFCLFLTIVFMTGLAACSQSVEEQWQEQYDLGVRYLSEGNYEEAIIAFTASIKIDPKQPDSYLKAAEVYIAMGDIDSAVTVLEQGYEETHDSRISEKLKTEQEILQYEWVFTDDMILPSDLLVGSVPFAEVTLEQVSSQFPSEFNQEYSIHEDDDIRQYTQYLQAPDGLGYAGWGSVMAQQNISESSIKSIRFAGNEDRKDANIHVGPREIQMWDSFSDMLSKLGVSEDGIEYFCSLPQGEEIRFICVEGNYWIVDLDNVGSVTSPEGDDSSVRRVEVVWPDFRQNYEDSTLFLIIRLNQDDRIDCIDYLYNPF